MSDVPSLTAIPPDAQERLPGPDRLHEETLQQIPLQPGVIAGFPGVVDADNLLALQQGELPLVPLGKQARQFTKKGSPFVEVRVLRLRLRQLGVVDAPLSWLFHDRTSLGAGLPEPAGSSQRRLEWDRPTRGKSLLWNSL